MTSTDKFVGYLVSVECKDFFYQGIVTQIDSNKALIQLKNVFQNGIHCGSKLVDIKTTEIENIEILADPQNALTILKPKTDEIEQTANAKIIEHTINKPISQSQSANFLKTNDSNNNNSSNNKNSTQPIKVSSQKHIKTSKSSHTVNSSNISPASVSPPSYHQNANDNSNKRKSYHGYSNIEGNQSDVNSMNVDSIEDEFDFEKNLALFDKNKLYEELGQPVLNNSTSVTEPQLNAYDSLIRQINSNKQASGSGTSDQRYHKISVANLFSSQVTPSIPAATNGGFLTSNTNGLLINSNKVTPSVQKTPSLSTPSANGLNRNYRFDEMVLGTGEPVNLQQIQVPCDLGKKYVTDEGFVIPCIDSVTRDKLFEQSYRFGFTKQRQIECMGRSCTEMAIQLIGGPIRFSVKNNHQKPTVLILANDFNIQGTYALCTARLLSIRSCKVHIFVAKLPVSNDENVENFENELRLFQSIEPPENTFIQSIDDLRKITSVDLIISSVDSSSSKQPWYMNLVNYIQNCKASTLSIDPDVEGSLIKSKWCVLPVLPKPMPESCGRVYLSDFGFTKSMFNCVNIKYQSPFGAKFCIPLHND